MNDTPLTEEEQKDVIRRDYAGYLNEPPKPPGTPFPPPDLAAQVAKVRAAVADTAALLAGLMEALTNRSGACYSETNKEHARKIAQDNTDVPARLQGDAI